MTSLFKKSLFIFRRDLRYDDNIALYNACKQSEKVMCVFIFTPEQIKKNKYKSNNCIQFMCECLSDLNISFFYGDNIQVIDALYKKYKYNAIYFNMDYTPYARQRDKTIMKWGKQNDVVVNVFEDYLIHPIGTILTSTGDPYVTYSAFRNNAKERNVDKPTKLGRLKSKLILCKSSHQISKPEFSKFYTYNKNIHVHGGRANAIKILKNIKNMKNYDTIRNDTSVNTTNLSAYNKFGCISIRELYHIIHKKLGTHLLLDQLLWRDFYYNLMYYFPHSQNKSFYKKYDKMKWTNTHFKKWCSGQTGFPLVDAGMRQLNQTGFMHNRVRMIVAQFLTKALLTHWKFGESYFATKLVDYDPSQNAGNWQWNASTGVDRFRFGVRTMNPSNLKSGDIKYIKKWIPELKGVKGIDIKNWETRFDTDIYLEPIVDYSDQTKKFKKIYNVVSNA